MIILVQIRKMTHQIASCEDEKMKETCLPCIYGRTRHNFKARNLNYAHLLKGKKGNANEYPANILRDCIAPEKRHKVSSQGTSEIKSYQIPFPLFDKLISIGNKAGLSPACDGIRRTNGKARDLQSSIPG